MTSNSIHLEPAYGQFYTEYDPQVHQPNALPPPPPPQYEMDTPNSHKPSIRDIETSYQYHAGYDQPIQQPLHQHQGVKSPYHVNPAYSDPYSPPQEYYEYSPAPGSQLPDRFLVPYQENPRSYLWLSIVVCFINPFFGLIAVIYSLCSSRARRNARMKKAKTYGRLALLHCGLGVGLTVIGLVIFLVLFQNEL